MALSVVATAYACEPNQGSEPGIGWNVVREVARLGTHLHVITRANNRTVIERALAEDPEPNLQFEYYDLPKWAGWWKRGRRGLQLYYYLWQIGAYRRARVLHQEHAFDLAHHVTFGRYWTPSFLPQLRIPFVWGPIGGGEAAPRGFWKSFPLSARVYESGRLIARTIGEWDPFVRRTARRCSRALPTTRETARRLDKMAVKSATLVGNAALGPADFDALNAVAAPQSDGALRFVSVGRLLNWKGFSYGLEAFARAAIHDAEYWVIGDGPERGRLEQLAESLKISNQVFFLGTLSREETLAHVSECSVLVHPSLHDSGGWVVVEAMAAARPVICLNLGGPAVVVDAESGMVVEAENRDQAVTGLAKAMSTLADDGTRIASMGRAARERAQQHFNWVAKAKIITEAYHDVATAKEAATS